MSAAALILFQLSLILHFYLDLTSVGNKGYTCQKCSTSRDGEELQKMASDVLLLSDKVSSLVSSGSILFHYY